MAKKLSEKQLEALKATVYPGVYYNLWARLKYDGRGGAGFLRTLDSLARRGLVVYDADNEGWTATDKGREILK